MSFNVVSNMNAIRTARRPLITCSVLCYNYGRFLAQAIESCLAQTLEPSLFEVLVIDDGSTDDTQEVCRRYEGRIRISRTENRGFGSSLARGLEEANGRYVAYLDADDWWRNDKLQMMLPHIDNGALVIMHPMFEVDVNGINIQGSVGACGNTSSVCVERSAGLTLLPATSEVFCRPLLDCNLGAVITEALGFYRIHHASMTDRSAQSSHTEFFARTNHVTSARLLELSQSPPAWATKPSKLLQLSKYYKSEGLIKDFERATELKSTREYPNRLIKMLRGMVSARRTPKVREWRLVGRALKSVLLTRKTR